MFVIRSLARGRISASRLTSSTSAAFGSRRPHSTVSQEDDDNRIKTAHQEMTEGSQMRPLYLDSQVRDFILESCDKISSSDFQATTPMDPRVLDSMLPYLTSYYGNPHSRTHAYGWESEEAVEKAREQIADLIKADPKEIVFTSGATESNNVSVKGVARYCTKSLGESLDILGSNFHLN